VKRQRTLRLRIERRIAEHFELLLTTMGVMIAIAITFAQLDQGSQGLALTFLVWLQGFILWLVRRHSLLGRRDLLRKTRVMLLDRINNQLTIMLSMAEIRGKEASPEKIQEDVRTALIAARTVAQELENLSVESVRGWERRFGRYLPAALR
jgi:hypothetical protein